MTTPDEAKLRFDEEQQLWAQVEALWEAAEQRDEVLIRERLHPRYSGWVTGSDAPHDYGAAIASVGAASPRILRYELTPLRVTVFDHDVGVAHYRYEADLETAPGRRSHVKGRWTEIYRKQIQGWIMIAVSGGPDGER